MRKLIPIALVTVTYTLVALVCAVGRGNGEFLMYIGVLAVLLGLVAWVHARVDLSHGALWGLCAWGFLHMAGGLVPVPAGWTIEGDIRVLYSWWLIPDRLKYDHLVHAFGFGITTWVCWQGLRAAWPGRAARPTFGLLVLCVTAGMGFGALNEIVEFAATLSLPETNVGGYVNTGWDLVSNLTGALTAAVLIRLGARRVPAGDVA